MQTVAFRSPYDRKMMVRIEVPRDSSVRSLGKASANAELALEIAEGKKSFSDYPLDSSGVIGLAILGGCMKEEDDVAISGMSGALSLARQIGPMIERNYPINITSMKGAYLQFEEKYGPMFGKYANEVMDGMIIDFANDGEKVARVKRLSRLLSHVLCSRKNIKDADAKNVIDVDVQTGASDEVFDKGGFCDSGRAIPSVEFDIVRT